MIFPPTRENDPATWAAVFAGHVAVGVCGGVVAAWVMGAPAAAVATPILYGAIWEGAIQKFGAGMKDAATDTFAVALGSAIIWAAWEHQGAVLAGSVVTAGVSVWSGIWRRL